MLSCSVCPVLCNPMDCSSPGSSVHGIPQVRIVEQVATSYSRGYSWSVLYNLWPWVWKGAWLCCGPLLTAAAVTEHAGGWEGPTGSTVGLTDLAASCLQSQYAFFQRAPCKGLPLGTIARTQGSCSLALCPSHFRYLSVGCFRPKKETEVSQSCLTLWNPMDCSLPGSSIHWILQARILDLVAIPFSRESYWPRNWTWVSLITSRLCTVWAPRESHFSPKSLLKYSSLIILHKYIFLF